MSRDTATGVLVCFYLASSIAMLLGILLSSHLFATIGFILFIMSAIVVPICLSFAINND